MGHRASYAIKENGAVSYYYSHWGANQIHSDFFFGPFPAISLVRSTSPDNQLLDDRWCEGGACIDIDKKSILLFGDIGYEFSFRELFLELLAIAWSGWSVSWAKYGIATIADYLEVPEEIVLTLTYSSDDFNTIDRETEPVDLSDKDHWISTIITIKDDDGKLRDVVSNQQSDSLLAAGPEMLLPYLERCPEYHPVLNEYGYEDTIFIDLAKKTVQATIELSGAVNYQLEKFVKGIWTGWTVQGHNLDLREHWKLTGREADFLRTLTITQQLNDLQEFVTEPSYFNPREFVDLLESKGEQVGITNPFFFDTYEILLDQNRKKKFFYDVMKKWKKLKTKTTS